MRVIPVSLAVLLLSGCSSSPSPTQRGPATPSAIAIPSSSCPAFPTVDASAYAPVPFVTPNPAGAVVCLYVGSEQNPMATPVRGVSLSAATASSLADQINALPTPDPAWNGYQCAAVIRSSAYLVEFHYTGQPSGSISVPVQPSGPCHALVENGRSRGRAATPGLVALLAGWVGTPPGY